MMWFSSHTQIQIDSSITIVSYHSKIWFFKLNFTYHQIKSTKYQISIIKLVCSILCILSFWSPPEVLADIIFLHRVLGSFNNHNGITLLHMAIFSWWCLPSLVLFSLRNRDNFSLAWNGLVLGTMFSSHLWRLDLTNYAVGFISPCEMFLRIITIGLVSGIRELKNTHSLCLFWRFLLPWVFVMLHLYLFRYLGCLFWF